MTDDQAKTLATAKEFAERLDDPDHLGFYYKLIEDPGNNLQALFEIISYVNSCSGIRKKGAFFTWNLLRYKNGLKPSDTVDASRKNRTAELRRMSHEIANNKGM